MIRYLGGVAKTLAFQQENFGDSNHFLNSNFQSSMNFANSAINNYTPSPVTNNLKGVPLTLQQMLGFDIYVDGDFHGNPVNRNNPTRGAFEDPLSGIHGKYSGIDFDVYPNPSSDIVWIEYELPHTSEVIISIQSVDGRELFTIETEENAGRKGYQVPELNSLSPGIYLLSIWIDNQKVTRNILRLNR